MTQYKYPFAFTEDRSNPVKGHVELEQPLPYQSPSGGSGFIVQAGLFWMTETVWTWFSTTIHILLILFTSGMQNWIQT